MSSSGRRHPSAVSSLGELVEACAGLRKGRAETGASPHSPRDWSSRSGEPTSSTPQPADCYFGSATGIADMRTRRISHSARAPRTRSRARPRSILRASSTTSARLGDLCGVFMAVRHSGAPTMASVSSLDGPSASQAKAWRRLQRRRLPEGWLLARSYCRCDLKLLIPQ